MRKINEPREHHVTFERNKLVLRVFFQQAIAKVLSIFALRPYRFSEERKVTHFNGDGVGGGGGLGDGRDQEAPY